MARPHRTDRIVLHGIVADTIVGVHEHERNTPRPVSVDLELACDLTSAARSDDLKDTVDYAGIAGRVRDRCAATSHKLIEALAGDIADLCLADPRVRAVTVTLRKPGAVPGVQDVAVVLERARTAN